MTGCDFMHCCHSFSSILLHTAVAENICNGAFLSQIILHELFRPESTLNNIQIAYESGLYGVRKSCGWCGDIVRRVYEKCAERIVKSPLMEGGIRGGAFRCGVADSVYRSFAETRFEKAVVKFQDSCCHFVSP